MLGYKWDKFYEVALYETHTLRIGERIGVALDMLRIRLNMLQGPTNMLERIEVVKCSSNLRTLNPRVRFDS